MTLQNKAHLSVTQENWHTKHLKSCLGLRAGQWSVVSVSGYSHFSPMNLALTQQCALVRLMTTEIKCRISQKRKGNFGKLLPCHGSVYSILEHSCHKCFLQLRSVKDHDIYQQLFLTTSKRKVWEDTRADKNDSSYKMKKVKTEKSNFKETLPQSGCRDCKATLSLGDKLVLSRTSRQNHKSTWRMRMCFMLPMRCYVPYVEHYYSQFSSKTG